VNYSTHPPEGKTTAAVSVMRGKGWLPPPLQYQALQKEISAGPVRQWSLWGPRLWVQRQVHAASLPKKAGSTVVEYFEWEFPD
jgi:hypothetical protein